MNKKYFISLLLLFSFYSVFSQTDSSVNWKIQIQESSLYDFSFINHWQHVRPFTVEFSFDSIIIGGNRNEPTLIPTDLPLDKIINYDCKKSDTVYLLEVKRINQSTMVSMK